jgi:hypothetical protein
VGRHPRRALRLGPVQDPRPSPGLRAPCRSP